MKSKRKGKSKRERERGPPAVPGWSWKMCWRCGDAVVTRRIAWRVPT